MTTNNTILFIVLMCLIIMYLGYAYRSREGLALGLPYMQDSYERLGVVRDKNNKIMYYRDRCFDYSKGFNSRKAARTANSKVKSTSLLRNNSIPVADSYLWSNELPLADNVQQVILRLGFPVVVKPVYGEKGYGVTAGVSSTQELISAVKPLVDEGRSVLVDKYLNGREYRIMVYDGAIVGVTKRSKPEIIGDGKHNVKRLIQLFNEGKGKSFKCHNVNERLIKEQGLIMSDVPSSGQKVVISNVANMSNGGGVDNVDLIEIHPDNLAMFKMAAQVCDLKLTGIDFITPSLLIPYHKMQGECGILEMNTGPGMGVHYHAHGEKKYDFIDGFIKRLFKYSF